MGFYIDTQGRYYEGDRMSALDTAVPARPTVYHDWNGTSWVGDVARADAALKAAVDKAAGDALLVYPSPGAFRDQEYRLAEKEAGEFKARGYAAPVPGTVQSWLANNDQGLTTAQQAADNILATASFMIGKLQAARDLRLKWKKIIGQASTVQDKIAARDAALAEIDAQL